MIIENMPCPICDTNDYHDCGDMHTEKSLVICKHCGALWHKCNPAEEDKLLEFYRKEYRAAPDHKNLIQTQNKLTYIASFLSDFLKDKKGLVCTDIGCATGYVPNWLRKLGHKATGTEYTTTFRRFAEHFYQILTTETIDKKHKYDLITFYHTLEHMMKPDAKLIEARDLLTEGGRIMVSVPRFMDVYDDPSTMGVLGFSNIYHKNHINLFTLQSVINLFHKCGLEIEKQNLEMYGMTFLLKRTDNAPVIVCEPWEKHLEMLTAHKQASKLFGEAKYKEAAELVPLFPNAHIAFIMQTVGKDPVRQKDEWEKVLAIPGMLGNSKITMQYAMWLQAQERYEEAVKEYDRLITQKPNADWFYHKGICLTLLKRYDEAIVNFRQCAQMQPIRWVECMDWAMKCACSIPTWEECAVAQIKEEMWKRNKDKVNLQPKDAVMGAT